ncbi:PSD1 and planctomycete cytochrome C domain-containing protein [Novipirellula artificiosorum]|uniref:Planctomycete cytochrome C n=1 Tax=Novipirellula artificiosorum TaxID=2528016 RepID=A0A5C6DP62_9BACT|nr:PSD1 and planctomycete cytochrome C domain-containing protein [Novipirellula artificiosorum]TWU38392.1 Planctomycete cytochrome C [Novipirellula artificiosorum]
MTIPCDSAKHSTGANRQRVDRSRRARLTRGIHALALRTCLILGCLTLSAAADDSADDDLSEVLFARRVAPLLTEKCLGCHGQDPDGIEGGIDLRTFEGLAIGGDSGEPGIVPGKPSGSSIFLAAARGEDEFSAMPPKESEALNQEQLSWLHDWIVSGAKWPDEDRIERIQTKYADQWSVDDGVVVATSGGLDEAWSQRRYEPDGLWAYQPLQDVEIPASATSAVDHLIEAALPAGLEVAPRADRQTLLRRASFDLTGLPPSPEQAAQFLNDPADDKAAFLMLVERLLDSPHYGERMAQHWLDVTRYADSSGFANDFERGNAWRYRDYVVRAFNEDNPYDDFIREQIAGDEIDASDPEKIVATGFLRMGPWELTSMEVAKIARQRFLDDVTNAVGETFLGHSLQCCRCHDHKFDPIPTQDYYSIQAVFATTQLVERRAEFLQDENTRGFSERQWLDKSQQNYQQTLEELDAVLLDNATSWIMKNGKELAPWQSAVQRARQNGTPGQVFNRARSMMSRSGASEESYPPVKVGFTPQQFGLERIARKGLQRLKWETERYKPFALAVYTGRTPKRTQVVAPLRVPEKPMAEGELETTAILSGGDPFSPTRPVKPGGLSVIGEQVPVAIPDSIDGRRKAFADWVSDPNNPLTSRVLVNRVWQWHFGKGIAGNPNNFGSSGKRPTHPKLLDSMASEFLHGGWSIKHLHRQIMNSDAYCRSTEHPNPLSLAELDPQAESYAAFSPRRLSAEEIRDSMLAVTGELNDQIGGIPCRPLINSEVALQPRQVMGTFASAWTPNPKPEQRNRRSIYVLKLRGLADPSQEVFNAPSPDFSCEKRDTSTVTPQVFAMFNSNNTHDRARALAHAAMSAADEPTDIVHWIYARLFARDATATEVERCLDHWRQVESMLPIKAQPHAMSDREVVREAVEENTGENFTFVETRYAIEDFEPDLQPSECDRSTRALADLCLVLLNSNEFVYIY